MNVLVECFGLHVIGEDIGQQPPEGRTLWGFLVCVVDGASSGRREILVDWFLRAWACRCLVFWQAENWLRERPENGLRSRVLFIDCILSCQRAMLLGG